MKPAILLTLMVTMSQAAQAPLLPSIYNPTRSANDQGLTLAGWGSGSIAETDEAAFEGVTSLRVISRNFFQGGVMSMKTPLDLTAVSADKNNLLMFALKVANQSMTLGAPAPGGGSPEGGGGGREGGGGRDGGALGAGGGPGAPQTAAEADTMTRIRMIFTTTDNKKSEVYLPINTSMPNDKGWRTVAVPLAVIKGFAASNKAIKGIALSSDATATFYIGEMKVVNDATPIYGQVSNEDMNVGAGTAITFQATGFGGANVLKYVWTFTGDKGDKIEIEGQSVARRFRRSGTYSVICTIKDAYDLKTPWVSNPIKVTVN